MADRSYLTVSLRNALHLLIDSLRRYRQSLRPIRTGLLFLFFLSACSKPVDVPLQAARLEKAFATVNSNSYVNLAISAVRSNNYAGGVVALQSAKGIPGMSPDQLMAVQQTLEAITADLVKRAAGGDPRAREDLAAIERSRSQ